MIQFKQEVNSMTNRAKKNLKSLSKEQLIQIITDYDMTCTLIDEVCVSESKGDISPKYALKRTREYLWETTVYDFNSENLSLQADLQMGKITKEEYRKKVLGG